ncbi:M15 family metallopeptidase [Kaistia terrae]|uniref:M15 family metallopeptidase n=1 Tax=Kaistia terrae TaxID=537017 RepID=A0ABW0PT45_9HYPH|nr:M15 family metallopeptidase [Kaistia terrae]MCX5577242.1 M15 family metallopeptidase [Kaistia terrae]
MARQQVREVSAPSAIQGVASPVDTYVRPAEPGRSSLHELAEGLAAFDSGLGGYLNKKKGENDKAEEAKAIVDFNRNNQVGWAEAVKQGLVPASSSPVYMASYKKSQGNLAGLRLGDKSSLDYQSWEGRHDADSAGYSAWASQWMSDNVGEEQDPEVLQGLAPHLERVTMGGLNTFQTERDERIKEGARATTGATITHALSETLDDGRATGTTDWNAFWDKTIEVRTEALARGEQEAPVDQLIVDSILLQAERTSDMEVLKLLDKKLPGKEHPMNFAPKIREAMTASQNRITAAQGATGGEIARQREAEEKAQQEADKAGAYALIYQNKEVPEELIVKLSRRDGDIRKTLQDAKTSAKTGFQQEEDVGLMPVWENIHSGAGIGYINAMRDAGVIKNQATYQKALDRMAAVKKAQDDGGIFTAPTAKDTVRFLTNATALSKTEAAISGDMPLSSEALEALHDYRHLLLDWEKRNPDASMMEKEKAALEAATIIRSRLQEDDTGEYVNTYQSDADRQKADAAALAAQQAAKAEAKGQADQASADAVTDTMNAVQDATGYAQEDAGSWWQSALGSLGIMGDNLMAGPNGPKKDPFASEPEPVIPPANQQVAPNGLPTSGDNNTTPPPAFETLSPARKGAVESFSQRNGVSLEEANRMFHEETQAIMGESGDGIDPTITNSIQPDTSEVSPETREKLTNLFSAPPRVESLRKAGVPMDGILGLIGHTEGTDRRNGYNETLGYGAYTGGDVNLVGMTLDQVDAMQTKMLRHKNNRWNSSASGRYQIVRTTLRSLRKDLGLKGNEMFDEKMQDRMAMHLLERRGLSKWQAGQMDDKTFLNNLSAEWASLPKANGRGTYKGQRAAATPQQVIKALHGGPPGHSSERLTASLGSPNAPRAYAKIPDVDGEGRAGQVAKFQEWNSDPVANHEANLKTLKPGLQDVIRRAQEKTGIKFVIGSGKRDAASQKKAVEWGWSKTEDSDHLDGNAVDLWPIDAEGAVNFESASQAEIVKAMKQAAKELGIKLDVGADWKSLKDKPHFAIRSHR